MMKICHPFVPWSSDTVPTDRVDNHIVSATQLDYMQKCWGNHRQNEKKLQCNQSLIRFKDLLAWPVVLTLMVAYPTVVTWVLAKRWVRHHRHLVGMTFTAMMLAVVVACVVYNRQKVWAVTAQEEASKERYWQMAINLANASSRCQRCGQSDITDAKVTDIYGRFRHDAGLKEDPPIKAGELLVKSR